MTNARRKVEDFLTNKATLITAGVAFVAVPVVAGIKTIVDSVTHVANDVAPLVANDDKVQMLSDNLRDVYTHPAGAAVAIAASAVGLTGLCLKDHSFKTNALHKGEDFLTNKSTLVTAGLTFLGVPVVAGIKTIVDAVTHVANDDEFQLLNDNLRDVYTHPLGATVAIATFATALAGLYLKDHPLKRKSKATRMTIMRDNKTSLNEGATLIGFFKNTNAPNNKKGNTYRR